MSDKNNQSNNDSEINSKPTSAGEFYEEYRLRMEKEERDSAADLEAQWNTMKVIFMSKIWILVDPYIAALDKYTGLWVGPVPDTSGRKLFQYQGAGKTDGTLRGPKYKVKRLGFFY
ncbi:hypothetical protein DID88_010367 [Monilinia fructigena]|uniref:Uncharacterized protein n=1 Tax=Monilinia fructigena TaxID=38457 RepID=A0A395INZ0_9HELO|nr:hypothetical protein DID88_010367 [Monilinia fructigena]